jgi:hypothetical protein
MNTSLPLEVFMTFKQQWIFRFEIELLLNHFQRIGIGADCLQCRFFIAQE